MSEISEDMSDKDDIARLKQVKETEPLQHAWDRWKETRQLLDETQELLEDSDPSMRSMASEEYATLQDSLIDLVENTFPTLLIPPSSTGHLSALLELKSGVGGSESSLFLGDLLRMYQRYAAVKGWKVEEAGKNANDDGGVKDAIIEVKGPGAYDALRGGCAPCQRVPATESKAGVVAMSDVKVEVMRARGAGGQHVNKTESAVRLTHIPSGITVSMQDERSQHQNRSKIQKDMAERRATRLNLVSGSDRSDKIRTYNFPQERVTDHRIGLTLMNLSSVLEGEGLQDFVEAIHKHQAETAMEDMLDVD
ncbi:peptide chain release factor 1 [Coprinopsis sp. MPI-PUGE-AT-0042]|nr:peptide chain release factor 1 [Coprinopsis sp. MPI-PUGE-AT-0042]